MSSEINCADLQNRCLGQGWATRNVVTSLTIVRRECCSTSNFRVGGDTTATLKLMGIQLVTSAESASFLCLDETFGDLHFSIR